MRSPTRSIRPTIVAALALAAGAAPALAQSSTFMLRGVIRDFQSGHVDFGPGHATGHYPGSVAFTAGPDGKPVYTGGGYEAVAQWRDRLGNPIAPHLWNEGLVYVQVASLPSVSGDSVADSYNSDLGPYDPLSAGPTPTWLPGSPMPVITEPSLSVPMTPSFSRSGAGTTVFTGDMRCNTFELRDLHTLRISGHVRIVVETSFIMRDGAQIQLEPGAECDIYIKGTAAVYDTIVGGPEQTDRLRIYNIGTSPFQLKDASQIYAQYLGPAAPLSLADGSDFFGTVIAQSVSLANSSGLHIDDIPTMCALIIDDSRGTAGSAGGEISSAASFAQWFEDSVGVNASRPHHLVMRDTSGVYEHRDDAFYPIDDKLYGNEGQAHNYYFTYEAPATFTYDECTGQTIRFEGSDDCWIYIDNRLIIDLGGVEPGTAQIAQLDRLNLVDGQTYDFRLFYAHRHAGPPRFNLQTNFELAPVPMQSGIADYPSHD